MSPNARLLGIFSQVTGIVIVVELLIKLGPSGSDPGTARKLVHAHQASSVFDRMKQISLKVNCPLEYGAGGGQGDLNLPPPVPFYPDSAPYLLAPASLRFFDCEILRNVANFFPYLSRFPPPRGSCFPPLLHPPPVRLPPSFLPVSRPLSQLQAVP